jgi:hypothetical protein
MTAAAGADRLDAHLADFDGLVGTARRRFDAGRWDAAAAWCQIAGMQAWMNPTGLFGSDAVEELLVHLGRRLPAVAARRRAEAPQTVLHVATQAYQTGGSTQEIACWIDQDPGRRHRVCVTRQGGGEIPAKIVDRLATRSDLIRLDTRPRGMLARALALREAAADADVVVLHVHPYDVLPAIAFAGPSDPPPVVYVDHADHVFWLGRAAARVLLSMRASGRALAISRRGIEPERCFTMPRPLAPAQRTVERVEAKRRLGLQPDGVLVVTAADGTKYRPVGEPAFLDLVVPVVQQRPEVTFRAAGPAPEGAWAAAAAATDGRLQALGRLPTTALLQQAADVYVDSFPFSSLTSLLEAGRFGTPAVTFRGHPEDCAVLGADTPGLDEQLLRPTSADDYRRDLLRLIDEPQWRAELGERTRRAIVATHTGAGWQAAVDELYERAARLGSAPAPAAAERRTDRLDVLVDLVMEQTGFSQGAPGALRANLGLLPARERISAWRAVARAGRRPSVGEAVPDWLRVPLAGLRRRAQAAPRLGASAG